MAYKFCKLFRFVWLYKCHPTFPDCPHVLGVYVVLDPAKVRLDNRAFVLDPEPLAILVVVDVSRVEVLYVLFYHLGFVLVRSKLQCLCKVLVYFF